MTIQGNTFHADGTVDPVLTSIWMLLVVLRKELLCSALFHYCSLIALELADPTAEVTICRPPRRYLAHIRKMTAALRLRAVTTVHLLVALGTGGPVLELPLEFGLCRSDFLPHLGKKGIVIFPFYHGGLASRLVCS